MLCDILDVTEDMGLMFAAVNAVGTIGTSNPDFAPKVRAHPSKAPRAHARACGRRVLLTRAGGRRASRRCGVSRSVGRRAWTVRPEPSSRGPVGRE